MAAQRGDRPAEEAHSRGVVAISLFSGCGGLDIGSHMAGVPVISSLDFDEDCITTLRLNPIFRKSFIIHDNICNISGKSYMETLKARNPEKLIVIGGPPCQPFSKAGYWITNNQRKSDKDPRNMIGEYLRLVSEIRPNGFLLENVESIMHPTNRHVIDYIVARSERMGYSVKLIRANALDYGVPQKRKRVIVVGSRKKFNSKDPRKTHGDPSSCRSLGLIPYVNAGDVIGKYDTPEYYEREEITEGGTYHEALRDVPPGKNYIALAKNGNGNSYGFVAGKRFWSFLLKLHPERPSWTIAAQPGPWVGPFHWNSRRLRVPEIAAIQTFPEDYRFHGSRRSKQQQIGNAVPPLLGKAMVEFLCESLQ